MLDELKSSILANLHNCDASFWAARKTQGEAALSAFVKGESEADANRAWYLLSVSKSYKAYCDCFTLMKNGSFYEAWCLFERVEIELADLDRNPFYTAVEFALDFLSNRVTAFQTLFPYRLFFSPEMIVGRRECGICGAVRTPWNDCGHKIGKVYMGRVCSCICKEVELLSISLVTNPVQKYSVGFSSDASGNQVDQYDYSVVAFVVDRLASPFHGWSSETTLAYHPHSMFPNVADTDLCPCESGQTYLACCRPKPGVVRPHLQFYFDIPPPPNLPQFELPKRED